MTPDIWIALTGVFVSIALITGFGTSRVLALRSPERRRLREMTPTGSTTVVDQLRLTEQINPQARHHREQAPEVAERNDPAPPAPACRRHSQLRRGGVLFHLGVDAPVSVCRCPAQAADRSDGVDLRRSWPRCWATWCRAWFLAD